jgi:hypothetical protein
MFGFFVKKYIEHPTPGNSFFFLVYEGSLINQFQHNSKKIGSFSINSKMINLLYSNKMAYSHICLFSFNDWLSRYIRWLALKSDQHSGV